jgi:mannose-6-phosphate isomerase-like protein (cupin superfamily)
VGASALWIGVREGRNRAAPTRNAVFRPHICAFYLCVSGNREGASTVFSSVTARRYEFPDGSLYDLVVPAASTSGARSEVDITLPPSPVTPPPHIHPQQQETFTVTDGTLEVLLGSEWRTLQAGESLLISPGSVHTFRNRSGQNVAFRNTHEPALGFEQYLERLYWLSAMNRIRGNRDLTSALYASLLLDTHRADQVPAKAGTRIRVRALAGVARLLRMRVDR